MKFSAYKVVYPLLTLWLLTSHVDGQVSQISPEWKAHFTTTPVISNCVFERKIVWNNNETHLYQFRWQTNAFLFRQIGSLSEASSNQIPVMMDYVGRFESNCWSIEWHGDQFGTLWLFPNADNIWQTAPTNGDEMQVYIGENELSAMLYYGIMNLDTATVKWSEDSKFTALSVTGQKIVGDITGVSQGLPTVLEWHFAEASPDTGFTLEYEYNNAGFDLRYFPSEIRLFQRQSGKKQLADIFIILILKTSPTPLAESFFDSKLYFARPPASRLQASTILFTNGQEFSMDSQAHLQKVLSASDVKLLGGTPLSATNIKLVRILFLGFFVISMIGLLFLWKHTKQQKTNQPKE